MTSREFQSTYPIEFEYVGHYLNILDPSFKMTGFGISTEPNTKCGTTFSQVFRTVLTSDAYTVDEYEQMLLTALAGPTMSAEQQALVAEKQAVVDGLIIARDNAQNAVNTAHANKNTAASTKTQKEQDVATATSNLTQAEQRASDAATALEAAESASQAAAEKALRAEGLTYSGPSTAEIADEDFSYLNAEVEAVRAAEDAVGEADSAKRELEGEVVMLRQQHDRDCAWLMKALQRAAAAQAAFDAARISIAGAQVVLERTSYVFDGTAKQPAVVSVTTADGAAVPADQFWVSYDGRTGAGGSTVTVKGKGDYKDAATATFQITRKPVSAPAAKTGLVYTGKPLTGVSAGEGYSVAGGTATAAGSYTATATLDANHIWSDGSTGPKTVSWTIASPSGGTQAGSAKPSTAHSAKAPVSNVLNVSTVKASAVRAIAATGAKTIVLGPKVKKISAKAFAGTGVTTVIVKSSKLKKATVKNAFKGSKVKTVKVAVKGTKSTKGLKGTKLKKTKAYNTKAKTYNKKLAKKYKGFMTKKVVGKKVTVKA